MWAGQQLHICRFGEGGGQFAGGLTSLETFLLQVFRRISVSSCVWSLSCCWSDVTTAALLNLLLGKHANPC